MIKNSLEIIAENLSGAKKALSSSLEIRLAFLCDTERELLRELLSESGESDVIKALYGFDGASAIWKKYIGCKKDESFLYGINISEEPFISGFLSLYDKLYICGLLSKENGVKCTPGDIIRSLSAEEKEEVRENQNGIRVSFIRGKYVNTAFEHFAKYIFDLVPYSAESFTEVCEAVCSKESDYGIMPVENDTDGRLSGFYRTMEKYGLVIVMMCNVSSSDGESYTKYALCARHMNEIRADGSDMFKFRITFGKSDELSSLVFAVKYFGASLVRVDLLPFSVSGRENSYDFIVNTDNADIRGLICFLILEYPQFIPVGIYKEIN